MPWRYERANIPPPVTKNRLPMIYFEAALYEQSQVRGTHWHVGSSTVMCFYGVGGARCVRAKAVNVITAFVGTVKDVSGV